MSLATQVEQLAPANPLNPDVDSRVFEAAPEAAFYVGVLATPEVIHLPREWQAARRLRANVYIDEMKFLPRTKRQMDGGENDSDDWRSVQFGILENMGEGVKPRMVGTSRLVIKDSTDQKLPVESMFPEIFKREAAPEGSIEVSRYIARHENRNTQRVVSLSLVRAMTAYALANTLEPSYAVVEDQLTRLFDTIHLPYEAISEPKMIKKYKSVNQAIKIYPQEVIDSIRPENHASSGIMRAFFQHTMDNEGLGYFDPLLINEVAPLQTLSK